MKRKLALFMVLAMLISLVPMNVFAATTNTIDSVPRVADDHIFSDVNTAPRIQIEEKTDGEFGTAVQTFRMKLTNAEWPDSAAAAMAADVTAGNVSATFTKLSATEMEANILDVADAAKELFSIPLLAEVVAAGDISVTVDGRDSKVTGGTYVFAIAGAGDTTTSIASVKTFADEVKLDTIQIDENKIGSLPQKVKVKLQLPAGFKWKVTPVPATSVTFGGGFVAATASGTGAVVDTDSRELVMTLDVGAADAQRGSVFIKDLYVTANSDAKVGDVEIAVKQVVDTFYTGKVTEQSVVVAKYANYDVTVKADGDARAIYAGDYDYSATGSAQDMNKVQTLIIKEEVANSWLTGRRTVVEFPSDVKIIGYKVTKASNMNATTTNIEGAAIAVDTYVNRAAANTNKVEMIHYKTGAATDKMEMKVQFFLSVRGDFTGDVAAKVYGTSMTKESSVVLAKVTAPAAYTAVKKDVKIGLQNQPVGDIIITEPAKGVWDSKSDGTEVLTVTLPSGFVWKTIPSVKVTKGDVTLIEKDIKDTTSRTLTIPVKYASTVASELTLTGGAVTLDRTIPEGEFKVNVGGSSIIDNHLSAATNGYFDQDSVGGTVAFNVITPAPGDTKTIDKVVFTIDSMEYMVGATKVTSDVAPFINEQGRTMLPLRAFANALNVSNDNIVWNDMDRSVVIFKGDATIKVVIGEMSFTKNGVQVGMDTMAIIKDGRTMLPLRAVAQALGATITWDEATRTVTVQ